MSDLTDYAEQQMRDWMSQGTAPATPPDPLYISLHTSDPGETPDGSTEVTATNYARESLGSGNWNTLAPADFGSGNGHGFENAVDVQWDVAQETWGTISHVAIWDGSTDTDNALASFAIDNSKTIDTDDQVKFAAGNLSFQID